MTSEEGKEESKEENPTTISRKNGNPPMIHVSADVLKEFMCSGPSESKKNDEIKGDLSAFDLPSLEPSSKKPFTNTSVSVPEINGISAIKQKDENVPEDSPKLNDVSDSTTIGTPKASDFPVPASFSKSFDSRPSPSPTLTSSHECSLSSSQKKALVSESETFSNKSKRSSIPGNEPTATETNQTKKNTFAESLKNRTFVDESASRNGDTKTIEQSKSAKITGEDSASVKSTEGTFLRENEEENQPEDDLDDPDDPQPGTPLSETLSQISLEETLLKDDDNDIHDDHEMDELFEEKLLQDTHLEKNGDKSSDGPQNSDACSDGARSLHLFDDMSDGSSKASENTSEHSQGNKSIDKILQDLNTSIDKTGKDDSSLRSNSCIDAKDYNKDSRKDSSLLVSRAESSNIKNLSEESSEARDSTSPVKEATTRSLPLPDHSESSTLSQKRSLPADFMEGAKSSILPSKMMRKDSSEEKRDTTESESASTPRKNPLTFREALKSIAMEDQLLLADKPQPLVPTTEISSPASESTSLTVLQTLSSAPQPKTTTPSNFDLATTGTKRVLVMNGEMSGSKPNLKKIRVIKASSSNIFKKGDVCRDVQSINLGLMEMSKQIESVKTMESRLLEEKALQQNKMSSEKSLLKENFVHIDKEELERRTTQEIRNASLGNNKLKRIKRKDLESLVIELFVDKVLYEHQLGQQKDLCKRLEATLETNRKKAAQFHKEVDDLKKVTQRLQAEHAARKNQIMAPVRVKRSVGIQATPTIIGKGIMQASTNANVRILTPSKNSSSSSSSSSTPDSSNDSSHISQVSQTDPLTITTPSPAKTTTHQNLPPPPNNYNHSSSAQTHAESVASVQSLVKQAPTFATQCVVSAAPVNLSSPSSAAPTTQMVVVNPVVVQQQPQNATVGSQILSAGTTRIVRAPLATIPTSTLSQTAPLMATPLQGGVGASRTTASSNVIDLTEDDEGSKAPRAAVPAGSVLTFQRPSGVSIGQNTSGQFVALNTPSSSVGQLVFVPPTLGPAPTALVVGSVSVAGNTQTLTTVGTQVRTNVISAAGTTRFSSPTTIVRVNGSNFMTPITRHPAPLPKAPPQQTSGYSKKLPPVPILKLSQKDNSIVLSWNMAKTDEHERIASYQLYAYQEGTAPPIPSLWKKVGSVKALDLPMACTLTQFMPGHVYHFAVRAVDIRSRLGPFSDPRSVRLGKQAL